MGGVSKFGWRRTLMCLVSELKRNQVRIPSSPVIPAGVRRDDGGPWWPPAAISHAVGTTMSSMSTPSPSASNLHNDGNSSQYYTKQKWSEYSIPAHVHVLR